MLRSANQNNNDCQWQSYHNSVARFHGCGWEAGRTIDQFVEKTGVYPRNTIHPTAQNITVFQPHPPLRRHPLQAWRGEERALGGSPPVPLSLRTSAHAGVVTKGNPLAGQPPGSSDRSKIPGDCTLRAFHHASVRYSSQRQRPSSVAAATAPPKGSRVLQIPICRDVHRIVTRAIVLSPANVGCFSSRDVVG